MPTSIILVVIFVIVAFVFLWAIKNGNNIKFKKKEKKKKEDKYKEVIPKDKPAKEEKPKEKPEKIRKAVKDEKSGKASPPTNKIMKVTKEDFKENDLAVPKTFDEQTERVKECLDDNSNISDFDLEKELEALGLGKGIGNGPSINENGFAGSEFEDFLAPMREEKESFSSFTMPNKIISRNEISNSNEPIDFSDEFFKFKPVASKQKDEGVFEHQTVEERFNKVFGEQGLLLDKTSHEVLVGDIMSGNRSRTNREARERRTKFMK